MACGSIPFVVSDTLPLPFPTQARRRRPLHGGRYMAAVAWRAAGGHVRPSGPLPGPTRRSPQDEVWAASAWPTPPRRMPQVNYSRFVVRAYETSDAHAALAALASISPTEIEAMRREMARAWSLLHGAGIVASALAEIDSRLHIRSRAGFDSRLRIRPRFASLPPPTAATPSLPPPTVHPPHQAGLGACTARFCSFWAKGCAANGPAPGERARAVASALEAFDCSMVRAHFDCSAATRLLGPHVDAAASAAVNAASLSRLAHSRWAGAGGGPLRSPAPPQNATRARHRRAGASRRAQAAAGMRPEEREETATGAEGGSEGSSAAASLDAHTMLCLAVSSAFQTLYTGPDVADEVDSRLRQTALAAVAGSRALMPRLMGNSWDSWPAPSGMLFSPMTPGKTLTLLCAASRRDCLDGARRPNLRKEISKRVAWCAREHQHGPSCEAIGRAWIDAFAGATHGTTTHEIAAP